MKTGIISELAFFREDRRKSTIHDDMGYKGFKFVSSAKRIIRKAKRYAKRAERRAGKALCQPDIDGAPALPVANPEPMKLGALSAVHAYVLGDRHYVRAYGVDGVVEEICLSE